MGGCNYYVFTERIEKIISDLASAFLNAHTRLTCKSRNISFENVNGYPRLAALTLHKAFIALCVFAAQTVVNMSRAKRKAVFLFKQIQNIKQSH